MRLDFRSTLSSLAAFGLVAGCSTIQDKPSPVHGNPVCGTADNLIIRPDIDCEHLLSDEQAGLTRFDTFPDGKEYYIPRDGQNPIGPLISAENFVTANFGENTLETVLSFDPGTDDFPAGALIIEAKERFELQSVIPSFGNAGYDVTRRNALRLIVLTGAYDVPVLEGSESALGTLPVEDTAAGAHGDDGLSGATERDPAQTERDLQHVTRIENGPEIVAQDILRRYEQNEAPLLIVAVGTLTDLYKILQSVEEQNPAALSKIQGVSIMGGGIDTNGWHANYGDGNTEWNFGHDGLAASLALDLLEKYKIPTIIVPLDVTHTTGVREDHEGKWLFEQADIKQNDIAYFISQMYAAQEWDYDRSVNMYGFGAPNATRFMHDQNAVTILTNPELYEGTRVSVTIKPEEPYQGMMQVTPDPEGTVFVALRADVPEVLALWQNKIAGMQRCPDTCYRRDNDPRPNGP